MDKRVGIVGTGLMGSGLARCLAGRAVEMRLYNRTRRKAEELAAEIGAVAMASPRELAEASDVIIIFISDDEALMSVLVEENGLLKTDLRGKLVVNMATVTPMASQQAMRLIEERGGRYVENPVYGSVDAARECRLFSIIATRSNTWSDAEELAGMYSAKYMYVGEPPAAMVLKLALNNLGLAFPALLAESLSLLKAWGLDPEILLRASRELWFGAAVERYWGRIMELGETRFRVEMAGKDYMYVARSLAYRGRPAHLSSAIASMYLEAARRYRGRDYPLVARYYMED